MKITVKITKTAPAASNAVVLPGRRRVSCYIHHYFNWSLQLRNVKGDMAYLCLGAAVESRLGHSWPESSLLGPKSSSCYFLSVWLGLVSSKQYCWKM